MVAVMGREQPRCAIEYLPLRHETVIGEHRRLYPALVAERGVDAFAVLLALCTTISSVPAACIRARTKALCIFSSESRNNRPAAAAAVK
jgi:hypothetical protein